MKIILYNCNFRDFIELIAEWWSPPVDPRRLLYCDEKEFERMYNILKNFSDSINGNFPICVRNGWTYSSGDSYVEFIGNKITIDFVPKDNISKRDIRESLNKIGRFDKVEIR